MKIQNIIIIGLILLLWSCIDQNLKETEIETLAEGQEAQRSIDNECSRLARRCRP